jgi:predicted SAM-dependent methyltransferase
MKKGEIWLELGAGAKRGSNNWITVDINGQSDVYHDLAKGIPFRNDSVARIYSSHLFEHLTSDEAKYCMNECVRVLKEGGEFSIAVPDARIFVDAYLTNQIKQKAFEVNTPMDYLNYIAYCNGQHKMMYDQASLCYFLLHNGLSDVTARTFDPLIDLECRKWVTIYARGIKRASRK